MFRSPRPSTPTGTARRRAAVALTCLAVTALSIAAAGAPAGASPSTFVPVASGAPARPAPPATPDPALTAHSLAAATGNLDNPDKGFAQYYFAGSNENDNVYPHSIEWSYFGLSEVMTDANNCEDYNWSVLDSTLTEIASYGNTAAIRFYIEYPGGTGTHPGNAIPACFSGHVSDRTDTYWGTTSPDYDSPFLISALGDFIAAFAARYDGDPRIGFVQAGLVGLWGEMHTWPFDGTAQNGGYPNFMPTNADFAKIVNDFADDFHRTKVEVRYPTAAGDGTSGLNVGYHDDSFCYREGSPLAGVTLPESLGGANYAQLQLDLDAGTENKWITDSMGGEVRPEIQSSAFSYWPGGSGQVDNAQECIELEHTTWKLDQSSESYSPTDPNVAAAVNEMGYNFTANNAYYTPSAAGSAEVGVQISNSGVAPFYYPWTMTLGLEDASGTIVHTWNTPWDIRTVMPTQIRAYPDWNLSGNPTYIPYGYPQYFQTDVDLSGVPAGSYHWVLDVANPLSSVSTAAKPLLFANATQNADGWLGLGAVTVNASNPGTAPSAPTGLSAAATASTIGLSWTAPASGTAAGYEVLRDGTVIATTASASYTDQFLPTNSAHSYTIEAFDAAGDMSAASGAVSASTTSGADASPPTAPAGLTSSTAHGDTVTLSWTQSTDDTGVAIYDIYRNGTRIGDTPLTSYTDLELTPQTAYQYTVKAVDAAGNMSGSSGPTAVTTGASSGDTTAPTTPTGLTSTTQAGTSIDLSWTASTDAVGVAGYQVFRDGTLVGATSATAVGTTNVPTPTLYTDTGLSPGTSHTYTVKAFDAAGNTSNASASVGATTVTLGSGGQGGTAPSVPNGLTSPGQTDTTISLTWNASSGSSGVAGYDIYRDGSKVATSTSPSFTDTGLTASTSYTYTVDAYDSHGDTSAQSSSVTVSTAAASCGDCGAGPSVPTGLTATQETASTLGLSWTASTDDTGVTGYDIYRDGTRVGTSTSTSYTDSGLTASTAHSYTVDAYDAAGATSDRSSALSTSTTADGVTGYEAESPDNSLTGTAAVSACSACSGSQKVGYVGDGATLTFPDVNAASAGSYTLTIRYLDGDSGRTANLTVNGTTTTVPFHGTGDNNWNNVQSITEPVTLASGTNTIELSNTSGWAPDLDQITVNATGSDGGGSGDGGQSYEAESSANTLTGGAATSGCSTCSGGGKVGYVGNGATLTFSNITEATAGSYTMTVYYIDGDAGRSADVTVNGTTTSVSFTGTNDGDWSRVQSLSITVTLAAGTNTIEFANPNGWAPDLDRIVV